MVYISISDIVFHFGDFYCYRKNVEVLNGNNMKQFYKLVNKCKNKWQFTIKHKGLFFFTLSKRKSRKQLKFRFEPHDFAIKYFIYF